MATKAMQNRASHGKSSTAAATTALPSAPVTRGKRKLNFSTSTSTTSSSKSSDMYYFRGKKLFLDLPGCNKIDQIEYELTERGGTVERRFHNGVKYLITNRPKNGRCVAGSQVDSPSTPSPHTPHSGASTRGGGGAMSKLSPSAESPSNVTPLTEAPGSRAALILAASQKGKKKSTDLRALAESWGCKVLSLSELLKELRKLKPLPRKEENTKKTPAIKVRKLKPPFLKVEDDSYSYRPLVYETRRWPRPDLNCSPKSCPFDVPKQAKSHRHVSPKEGAATGEVPKDASSPEAAVAPPIEERRRPGYCECCSVRYGDLTLHLKSTKHLEYAHNEDNFTSLDDVIAKGTKFEDFVASVRAKHSRQSRTPPSPTRRSSPRKTNSPYKTVVNLVTPPSSPPKRAGKSPSKSPSRSPSRVSNPSKQIILDHTGGFVSPKRGQLCLTPVKDSSKTQVSCTPVCVESKKGKEYTPGFSTPPQKATPSARKTGGGGSRIDPVTRALLQNSGRLNTRLRAQKEREMDGGRSTKGKSNIPKTPVKKEKHLHGGDIVPETPEKDVENHRRNKVESPLVNFQSLIDCIAAKAAALSRAPRKQRFILASDIKALVEEITRRSSSSPVRSTSVTPNASPLAATTSALAVRKSPRLVERKLQRFRPSVTTKTEKVTRCLSLKPDSLVVSFNLDQIYPRHKRRSAILAEQAIRTPKTDKGAESVTPEIEFQGVALPRDSGQRKSNNLFTDRESPLTGLRSSSTPTTTSARRQKLGGEHFFGFSPDTVREALPNGVPSERRVSPRSPSSCSKMSVDKIAMKLAARITLMKDCSDDEERLGRKRGLDQSDSDDDECVDPHLSPPPAKRRRVSISETTPSPTPQERPCRRSPRLAMSRKFRSSSNN